MPASALRVWGAAAALALAVAVTACGSGAPRSASNAANVDPPSAAKHYAVGTSHDQSLAVSLGFDVMDIAGSHSNPRATKAIVDALPPGVQGLIWVGNLDNTKCSTPGYTTAQFRALVDAMATDPKVYGYSISDEPHPLTCTNAVVDVRGRADYLHAHSSFQKAFIVIADGYEVCGSNLGCEFRILRPANTHVDLVGLDPYPCHYASPGHPAPCNYGMIKQRVAAATASGIAVSRIVPVFQTFGSAGSVGVPVYYRLPTPSELATILSTWHAVVPNPPMDYAYTFGVQCSTTCPAPQALANHPELQPLIRAHNG
jgi:hypothetical protein